MITVTTTPLTYAMEGLVQDDTGKFQRMDLASH